MKKLLVAAALAGLTLSVGAVTARASVLPAPTGWTCTGKCGSDTADGSIPLSPLNDQTYQYVTTTGGSKGVGINPLGAKKPTDGSFLMTSVFTATADTSLTFYFNYITSDGGKYADNGWAALYNANGTVVSEIYDSTTGVSIANGGASNVSWLGSWSGACYAGGCGNTGWTLANYLIDAAGSYYMAFGVTNAYDTLYDSGLAIDGVAVNGQQISPTVPVQTTQAAQPIDTPEPASAAVLAVGLLGLLALRRTRAA